MAETKPRGGARPRSGAKPKYKDRARLSIDIEQDLLDDLDTYRRNNPVELAGGGISKRHPECPKGFQPATRASVVGMILKEFFKKRATL